MIQKNIIYFNQACTVNDTAAIMARVNSLCWQYHHRLACSY